jgi:hypothetical protein
MGKRAGTPTAEYLCQNGGEPGSPSNAYRPIPNNTTVDGDLDFHIHGEGRLRRPGECACAL